jgi:peptidoglycan-associated lipoprotein
MKRLFPAIIIALVLTAVTGCAPKKMSQGLDKPADTVGTTSEIKPSPETEKSSRATGAEDITTKQLPRETVQEKTSNKAATAESQQSAIELRSMTEDIHFDFDSYSIREEAKPVLKRLSDILSADKNVRIVVEGHCDDRGTTEYNLGLGDKRANSVKEYLLSMGIPANMVETVSYGKEKPLCAETTEDCRVKNRRAHFVPMLENQ